ncbi:flotillin-1 isoform X2 [Tyto alba]|uniref:flotillin-1 isoform X2 n=1 Tax=Tyto alba TaxID=56313 RepID=UPI001C674E97|nr:flotillin-1 isoform X2 [Tyto alba]
MFFTCGPNEAMVVSGFCRSPPVMVAGGRVLVVPCLQQIQRISLNTLTLNVRSEKVYTRHGVPISVTGIAQEIYKDRQKFSEQVFNVASSDLVNMGISVVSYTLKDIHDDQDYLHSLGKGRTAQVQRDARVGEAEAKRDAGIREARARQEQVSAQLLSETAMAQAQRDFQVQQALCDAAVSARKAQADLAYQLQVARTKQQIEEQRAQVLVVERAQQAQLQEHEIGRRERELEATVRKPAEAERYRLERLAEAQRSQVMMQAEAEAEAMRPPLAGDGRGAGGGGGRPGAGGGGADGGEGRGLRAVPGGRRGRHGAAAAAPGGGGGSAATVGDASSDAGGRRLRGHRGVAAPGGDPGRRHPPARCRRGSHGRQRHPGQPEEGGVPGLSQCQRVPEVPPDTGATLPGQVPPPLGAPVPTVPPPLGACPAQVPPPPSNSVPQVPRAPGASMSPKCHYPHGATMSPNCHNDTVPRPHNPTALPCPQSATKAQCHPLLCATTLPSIRGWGCPQGGGYVPKSLKLQRLHWTDLGPLGGGGIWGHGEGRGWVTLEGTFWQGDVGTSGGGLGVGATRGDT